MKKSNKKTGKWRGWLIAAAVAAALAIGGAVGAVAVSDPDPGTTIDGLTFIDEGDFGFVVEDGVCCVQIYYGSDSDVVIPSTCNEYAVEKISTMMFQGNTSLTSVTIPDTVYHIGYRAFYNCENLASIELPDSLISIDDSAFACCSGLVSVGFPEWLDSIGSYAFSDCSNLTDVVLPEGLKELGRGAFDNCDSLTNITIPPKVSYLHPNTFRDCDNLTTVTVNHDFNEFTEYRVDLSAFIHCRNLKTINLPSDTQALITDTSSLTLGLSSLEDINILNANAIEPHFCTIDGIVYDLYGNEMIYCPRGRTGELVVPEGTIVLGDNSLGACQNLTSVSIPASLTGMGSSLFRICTKLENINVAEDNPVFRSIDGIVYSKDGSVLLFCPMGKIGDLVIPEGVTRISDEAFYGCEGLDSITIPESMESIGDYAFDLTNGLSVYAPHLTGYYGCSTTDYMAWYSSDGGFEGWEQVEGTDDWIITEDGEDSYADFDDVDPWL